MLTHDFQERKHGGYPRKNYSDPFVTTLDYGKER